MALRFIFDLPSSTAMANLPVWLQNYCSLPSRVFIFAGGQFLINLINSAQFLLLNLFLKSRSLDDPAIAALSSQRFVATLFLAIPAGLWLRGRPLKQPIFWGSILFPLTTLVALEAVNRGHMEWASYGFLAMGFSSLLMNVAGMPMALRLAPQDKNSETLSLLFATWAAASVLGGVVSSILQKIGHVSCMGHSFTLDEYTTLLILTILGLAAPLCYAKIPNPPAESTPTNHWLHIHRQDIKPLTIALIPTLCIATGAGLSIQFLNLFFSSVFHLSSADYSTYGSICNLLVMAAGLLVPEIKRRLGWRGAILGVQLAAVILLATMGLTELWKTLPWALPLAILCFILRQPLMSMAGPATGELTMIYVGERNRELVSACNGAIWSGSWWIAARTFEKLRVHELPYWQVFMITALLYTMGVLSYLILIRKVETLPTTATPAPTTEPDPI